MFREAFDVRRCPPLTEQELVELFAASWPGIAPRGFAPVLARSLAYFGAFAEGRLVGFVNVAWDGGIHGFVLDTTVHPSHRRRGIARELLARAADDARARGIQWLHVDFEPEMEPLYRSAGYGPTSAGVLRLEPVASADAAAGGAPGTGSAGEGAPALPAELHTGRLHLRRPTMADSAALFAEYGQDPDVTRYLVWRPHADAASFERFLRSALQASAPDRQERWVWVLTLAGSDSPVGMLDVQLKERRLAVGYVLARRCWGQGYMPEALQPIVDVALRQDAVHRVWAVCDVENRASARVLEKVGMRHEGILRRFMVHPNAGDRPRDCHAYARVKEDAS